MSQTDIAHRLRCKYPMGPTQENGEPEFGWRDFSGTIVEKMSLPSSVMLEAADHIDAQAAEIERLREALAEIAEYWNRDQNDQAMNDACWHAINTANAALSGEPT